MTLFGSESRLSKSARKLLDESWASGFRKEVLPILMQAESDFAKLYSDNGRPNWSVGRLLGICLLQEMQNLSDQDALNSYSFDIRWHYALCVDQDDDYLSRRSLVEFRRRLVEVDPQMKMMHQIFERVSNNAIAKLGISINEQRADSTLITSNIRTKGLVDLLRKTLEHFCLSLDEKNKALLPKKITTWLDETKDGWFAAGDKNQRQQKKLQLCKWLYQVKQIYKDIDTVKNTEAYLLVVRILNEHCEVVENNQQPSQTNHKDSGVTITPNHTDSEDELQIRMHKPEHPGVSLQSPYDPDAGCGHKGPGYHLHVVETCNNQDRPEIITGYELLSAGRSDKGKGLDIVQLLIESGRCPKTIFMDAGYPTANSIKPIVELGVELMAPVHRVDMPKEKMGRDSFTFDGNGFITQCPAGHRPVRYTERIKSHCGRQTHAVFDGAICRKCSLFVRCPVAPPNNGRQGSFRIDLDPGLRLRDEMFARQQDNQWWDRYRIRSGVEATMSELKRHHGIGRLRVRRMTRVHLAVICKLTACNIKRWLRAVVVGSFFAIFMVLWRRISPLRGLGMKTGIRFGFSFHTV
ncbi:transposase [Candidatus Woesearchaeota archaeon]|nr:transposase [Candidatus Woesearchaeota archaeon]